MRKIILFVFVLLAVPAYAGDVVMKLGPITNSADKSQVEFLFYMDGKQIATEILDVKQGGIFLPATGTIPDGIVRLCYENKKCMDYTYKNNLPNGKAIGYSETGKEITLQNYKDGKLIDSIFFHEEGAPNAGNNLTSAGNPIHIVDFAKKGTVEALNYIAGNRESLVDAQDYFSPEEWQKFMSLMQEWLDEKGNPKSSSNFIPTEDESDISTMHDDGITYIGIPGVLKQTQNSSDTTYQAKINIQLSGNPIRITSFEVATCGKGQC